MLVKLFPDRFSGCDHCLWSVVWLCLSPNLRMDSRSICKCLTSQVSDNIIRIISVARIEYSRTRNLNIRSCRSEAISNFLSIGRLAWYS